MVRVIRRIFSIALVAVVILGNMGGVAFGGDEVSRLKRALGGAFYSRAELALLKGELNKGKVYLAASHDADPCISPLGVKAMDMMYKDFPFVDEIVPGYSRGASGFSGDHRFVAFSHGLTLVRLDLATGEIKKVQMEGGRLLLRLGVSPKGRFVVVSDNIGNFTLFDMESEKAVGSYSFRKELPRSLESIKLSFSFDEKTIAAYYGLSEKRAIYFLRSEDLSVERTLPVKGDVWLMRYIDDDSLLLNMGNKIVIAESSTLKLSKTLSPVLGFDADYLAEKNLVAVGGRGTIRVFDTETHEKVAEYQGASHNNVLVRYLAGGRYIVYGSPKGESGVIDCSTGKVMQVFDVGRNASVSTDRYLLLAEGKVIDLSACRGYEGVFKAAKVYAARSRGTVIPDSVVKALSATVDKAISKSGGSISYVVKSESGRLGAFSTGDGRTFIYEYDEPAKVDSVTEDLPCLTTEVKLVLTNYFSRVTDLVFFSDESHLVRLCKSGNGMVSAVEVYSLVDGSRYSLRLEDSAERIKIVEEENIAIVLDRKNRVFLSTLPKLDCKVDLLGATEVSRQIYVDQQSKTLVVKTGEEIDSYDLSKVSADATILTYEDAVKRYGVSLDKSEPLWDLVGR